MKIPARLSHLRTDRRGIPVPWINRWGDEDINRYEIRYDQAVRQPALFLPDDEAGGPDFFHQNHERQRLAMVEGLCQVCGRPVPWSRRFLVVSGISVETVHVPGRGEVVLISEPWLDELCATFALEKCPGLIRRRKADNLHLMPVIRQRDVELVVSNGWVDGPLEEESKRVMPAMWVKAHLLSTAITVRPRTTA